MDKLLQDAQEKGYFISVYEPGLGEKIQYLEIELLKQWLFDEFCIFCWVQPLKEMKFTPYYRDLTNYRSKNQKLMAKTSHKRALIDAISDGLKLI